MDAVERLDDIAFARSQNQSLARGEVDWVIAMLLEATSTSYFPMTGTHAERLEWLAARVEARRGELEVQEESDADHDRT